jgi:hypothetical protein
MSKPYYRLNQLNNRNHKRIYHVANVVFVVILLAIAAIVLAVVSNLSKLNDATSKSVKGATIRQSFAGPETFKSAYFEFSDTNKWVYAPNDSTANKVTYLLYEDGVPAHSLTVYINQAPLQYNLATTRVLPVQIINDQSFNIASISAPCSSLYSTTDPKVIKTVSLEGASFLCVPDSPQFSVIVGQIDGNYELNLRRSNGHMANYIIIYHNLSVDPDPTPFLDIMRTFVAQ